MEQLDKAVKDAHTVCCELSCGVLMQHIKRAMFNGDRGTDAEVDVSVDDEHVVENNAEDIAPPASFEDVELPDEVVLVEAVN
ncbi:unnamed protein product [Strongylus vulgaris]|uniref:Uncharacterized protein n=1 Tax=Strongylus vulgaris TaxID=40348 RepID=A0A3P7M2L1_STRVU|nr:unnamed protein product [Strongylus vulgaris]